MTFKTPSSKRFLGLGLLLGALTGACAGPSTDDAPATPKADIQDPVVLQASATTRSDIGVETWGIYAGNASLIVRGYDASNAPVVQFEQVTTATDDVHGSVEINVIRKGITTTMKVELEAQPSATQPQMTTRVVANTLAGDADARHVLDLLIADSKSQQGALAGGKSAGSQLVTKSIHPSYWGEGIVNDVKCSLNVKCGVDMVQATTAVVVGGASCGLVAAGAVATVGCVATVGVASAGLLAAGCVVAEGATVPAEAAGCVGGITGGYAATQSANTDCGCK